MTSKATELEARVGNRELHYFGKQGKQTLHLWKREVRKRLGGADNYAYVLRRTERGHADEVYCKNSP